MKKDKASPADIFYITNNSSLSVDELSKATSLKISSVRSVLANLLVPVEQRSVTSGTTTAKKPETQLSKSLGRNTKYGAVVMTQAASEIADATRTKPKHNSSIIFKPRGDE